MQSRPNGSATSAKVPSQSFYSRRGKRALDITLTLLAAFPATLLGLCAALAVRVSMGSPVMFRQTRTGQRGEPFEVLKFRTMRVPRYPNEPDTPRLTRTGRVLRKSSLDELPNLWNVLKGQMSLVGPRPLLPRYLPWYTARERKRFDVRPGITGLAQVSGRNCLDWEGKLSRDVLYVESLNVTSDLAILWRTAFKVLLASDVAADNERTETYLDEERSSAQSATSNGASVVCDTVTDQLRR